MWRSVCIVVLLPSLTIAQTAAGEAQGISQFPSQQTLGKSPTYRQYTYYRQVRRGTTEKAAIELVLGDGFVISPRAPVAGIAPVKLEMEAKDGITVEAITYPRVSKHAVSFQKEPINGPWDPTIKFKIHTDKQTTLGDHTLRGKLIFQVVTATGISQLQQLDIEIPLNVVEGHAKVKKTGQFHETPKWEIVVLIVLAPVALVLLVPVSLACNAGVKSACF